MSLSQLINNNLTDKCIAHSYIYFYETLFKKIRFSAENILEIGINQGGSIKLWRDYFTQAHVYGLDLNDHISLPELKVDPRVHLYTANDAYDPKFVRSEFYGKNIHFDVIIDDGPHTLESMKDLLTIYPPLLKDSGLLIIEDVQKFEWMEVLRKATPYDLQPYVEIHDLRNCRGRYDDLLFVINKNKTIMGYFDVTATNQVFKHMSVTYTVQ